MFAHDDFLVHLDFGLALRRDLAEATTAGVAVNGYDGEAVAGGFADAFVGGQVVILNILLLLFGFFGEALFVFLGLLDD